MLNLTSYRFIACLMSPLLWAWDLWRAYRQPIYQPFRRQRWGRDFPVPLASPCIWIHAVSVGETLACAPLLRAILQQHPKHHVLLTHMTPTGRDTGAKVFAEEIKQLKVQQCYLPYDLAGLSDRFLEHFKPQAGIIMETEVWPNLVAACLRLGIPVGLANGRMSAKTLGKTLRFPTLARQTYSAFSWVAAQSRADAGRFAQLGVQSATVTGNLKFDVQINQAQLEEGQMFRHNQDRLCFTLASTREGEEAVLLPILLEHIKNRSSVQISADAKSETTPLILLVPRHPKRADELLVLLKQLGVVFAQRSKGEQVNAQTQVYLGDTLGEMWFYYGASDVAVVGGGWLPHGGQNPIEPCMLGCVTVVGPHMFNFAAVTQDAVDAQALMQCTDATQLKSVLPVLDNPINRTLYADRAREWALQHQGATQRHLTLLRKHVL